MIDEKKTVEHEENWISETGLNCHIYPCNFGNGRYHLCGYVRIPEGHPLYKVNYSSPVPQSLIDAREKALQGPIGKRGLIDVVCMGSGSEMRAGVLFDVHGGITFSGPLRNGDPEHFWYGFDCGHCDDNNETCNAAYVRNECESLARQMLYLCGCMTGSDNEHAALEAEIRSGEDARGQYIRENAALEARCRDLTEEVRYLRTYGNKDCTAMADTARASSELETPVYPYQQPSGLPAQTSTTGVHPNGGPCIHVWALTNRDAVENGRCGICGQSVANRSVKP